MKKILVLLLSLSFSFCLNGQDIPLRSVEEQNYSSHSFYIGTQIPLQYTAGYAFRFSDRLSARAQAGILTKPYDRYILSSMEAFGLNEQLSRVIEKSFQGGTFLGLGANYHFGKNYTGLHGQYLHLRSGGVTPADALAIYFNQDFSSFDPRALPDFEFSMQSNMFLLGALVGRQFQLSHPRWRVDGEVSLAKIIGSNSTFASNRAAVDRTALAQSLYSVLDQQVGDAYRKHGWLPTVNVYLVYQLRRN